ncbi:hypothetical protein [Desulfocastanea catecholica]
MFIKSPKIKTRSLSIKVTILAIVRIKYTGFAWMIISACSTFSSTILAFAASKYINPLHPLLAQVFFRVGIFIV